MHDLTGAGERRTTALLAMLVLAVLVLPVGVAAQEGPQPMTRPTDPAPTAEPTPEPEPTREPEEAEAAPLPEQPVEVPQVPGATEEPSPEPTGPAEVEAEGAEAEEVAAPPVAPEQPAPGQPQGDEVASADDQPAEAPAAGGDPAAPPAAAYGPQITPSLGTATAPNTNQLAMGDVAAPLVMAPQVAGQRIAVGGPQLQAPRTASAEVAEALSPVRGVAAMSLTLVQPSPAATATALVLLVGAAGYAAVLRSRGQEVPAAIAIPTAVRPGDRTTMAARSVRPGDLAVSRARSIRP